MSLMRELLVREISNQLRTTGRSTSIFNYEPHEKQQEFHASRAQGRIFLGGNRSGKTVGGGAEMARAATGTDPHNKFPPPPLRLRSCSVDRLQGIYKITLPEVRRWLPTSSLIGGSWERSWLKTESTLRLDNGSEIEFLTYEQDVEKHAGVSRHGVWFDEEPPEAIFNENMLRLVDTNGRWWLTCTPVEGMDFLVDLYENKPEYIDWIEVESGENPHLNKAALQVLLSTIEETERDTRLTGHFAALGAKIYQSFGAKNIIDPFRPPRNWTRINGFDHGIRNPAVWLFGAVNPEGELFIYDEIYERGLLVPDMASLLGEKEEIYGPPLYRVGDPSIRNRDPIAGKSVQMEYAARGFPINLGNNDLLNGISRVQTFVGNPGERPKLFVSRNCTHTIDELKKYRWANWANKKDEARKSKKEEPVKRNDHSCDALRYIIAALIDVGLRDWTPNIREVAPHVPDPVPARLTVDHVTHYYDRASQQYGLDDPLGGNY